VGFEPTVVLPTLVFKTSAFGRSATLPRVLGCYLPDSRCDSFTAVLGTKHSGDRRIRTFGTTQAAHSLSRRADSTALAYLRSGRQGTRTLNPVKGNGFRNRPLSIRISSKTGEPVCLPQRVYTIRARIPHTGFHRNPLAPFKTAAGIEPAYEGLQPTT
jgi:hypothetical protein